MKTTGMTQVALLSGALISGLAGAELQDKYIDHGVAVPISHPRGIVATVDGMGNNTVLVLPMDGRGAYMMLQIDASTGKSTEVPLPFNSGGDAPYSSILSRKGKYYGHLGYHFFEYDPCTAAFTACYKSKLFTAMSMHEDDNGVIWSATYPEGGLASYDPGTRKFVDYGPTNKENWAQYPRSVTSGKDGWIYVGIGNTNGQISCLNPLTRETRALLKADERPNPSSADVSCGEDGVAYGQLGVNWYRLIDGTCAQIDNPAVKMLNRGITSSQNLFHNVFPDGGRVETLSLVDRIMTVFDKDGKAKTLKFGYGSEGCHVMGIAAVDDGNIYGGTAFPMRFFKLDTRKNEITNQNANGYQFNTVLGYKDNLFIGAYCGGFMLRYRYADKWTGYPKAPDLTSNPAFYGKFSEVSLRPHALEITPDGKTLIMGGTPLYGCTGGGLAIVNLDNGEAQTYPHAELALNEAPNSLVAVDNGLLVVGTTVSPGTGGEKKAKNASILGFDLKTRKCIWAIKPFEEAQHINDLLLLPDGTVLGIINSQKLFRIDAKTQKIIAFDNIQNVGNATGGQGVRALFMREGKAFLLASQGLCIVDTDKCKVEKVAYLSGGASGGGDFARDRFYYYRGTHIMSVKIDDPAIFEVNVKNMNGRFQRGAGKLPDGWSYNGSVSSGGVSTCKWSTLEDGSKEVAVDGTANQVEIFHENNFFVKPGDKFTVEATVAGTGIGCIGIYTFNAKGTSQGRPAEEVALSPEYRTVKLNIVVPPEYPSGPTTRCRFFFGVRKGNVLKIKNFSVE